jgi:hypothetical protein
MVCVLSHPEDPADSHYSKGKTRRKGKCKGLGHPQKRIPEKEKQEVKTVQNEHKGKDLPDLP